MTDIRDTDAEQRAFERIVTSSREPGESPPTKTGRHWRKWAVSGVVAPLVIIGAWLLIDSFTVVNSTHEDTLGELDTARASLSAAAGENDALTEDLAAVRADLRAETVRADETAEQLTQALGDLTEARAELAEARAELADASSLLGEAEETRQAVVEFLSEAFSLGAPMDEAAAACLADTLVAEMGIADFLTAAMNAAQLGAGMPDAEMARFGLHVLEAADECGVAFDSFIGGLPGDAYGDNPLLDSLHDACAAGSGVACDQLYMQSAVGSEYERFGATCGDRFSLAAIPMSCVGQI